MKTIKLIFTILLTVLVVTSCKTKQKVAEIPAGANVVAAPAVPETRTEVSTPAPVPAYSEPEVTRNENFSLAEGESSDALKYKYHVVVGSFSKTTNAKGLQSTLKSEGNNAIVVVNENGMYRVLIASYNEYSQARAKINQIKNRFPDAWVLVKR